VRVSCGKMRLAPFGPVPRCSGSLQPSPSITGLATRGTGELLGYCASTSWPCGGSWTSGCKCVCRSRSGQTSQTHTKQRIDPAPVTSKLAPKRRSGKRCPDRPWIPIAKSPSHQQRDHRQVRASHRIRLLASLLPLRKGPWIDAKPPTLVTNTFHQTTPFFPIICRRRISD
jgi:hypothetical protein